MSCIENVRENSTTGRLMFVCVETGKEVESGVVYKQNDLERAESAKLAIAASHTYSSFSTPA
jgi:hypothetical protein